MSGMKTRIILLTFAVALVVVFLDACHEHPPERFPLNSGGTQLGGTD